MTYLLFVQLICESVNVVIHYECIIVLTFYRCWQICLDMTGYLKVIILYKFYTYSYYRYNLKCRHTNHSLQLK